MPYDKNGLWYPSGGWGGKSSSSNFESDDERQKRERFERVNKEAKAHRYKGQDVSGLLDGPARPDPHSYKPTVDEQAKHTPSTKPTATKPTTDRRQPTSAEVPDHHSYKPTLPKNVGKDAASDLQDRINSPKNPYKMSSGAQPGDKTNSGLDGLKGFFHDLGEAVKIGTIPSKELKEAAKHDFTNPGVWFGQGQSQMFKPGKDILDETFVEPPIKTLDKFMHGSEWAQDAQDKRRADRAPVAQAMAPGLNMFGETAYMWGAGEVLAPFRAIQGLKWLNSTKSIGGAGIKATLPKLGLTDDVIAGSLKGAASKGLGESALTSVANTGLTAAGEQAAEGFMQRGKDSSNPVVDAGKGLRRFGGNQWKTAGYGAKMLGFENLGNNWVEEGETQNKGFESTHEMTGGWSDMLDPYYWSGIFGENAPTSLAFIPLGIAGRAAGAGAAGLMKMGKFGTAVMEGLGAASLTAPLESAMEAAGTYEQMFKESVASGMSKAEAHKAAQGAGEKTWWRNMALLGITNAYEFRTLFGAGNKLTSNAKKMFQGGTMEGGQEMAQQAIQDSSMGKPIDLLSPDYLTQGIFGAAMGIGMGSFSSSMEQSDNLVQSIKTRVFLDMNDETQAEVAENRADAAAQGIPQDQADELMLERIAEQEPERVHAAVEAIKESEITKQEVMTKPDSQDGPRSQIPAGPVQDIKSGEKVRLAGLPGLYQMVDERDASTGYGKKRKVMFPDGSIHTVPTTKINKFEGFQVGDFVETEDRSGVFKVVELRGNKVRIADPDGNTFHYKPDRLLSASHAPAEYQAEAPVKGQQQVDLGDDPQFLERMQNLVTQLNSQKNPESLTMADVPANVRKQMQDRAYGKLPEDSSFELRKVKLTDLEQAQNLPFKLDDVDRSKGGRSRSAGKPIMLDGDMSVLDGMHRIVSAIALGEDTIDAYVRVPSGAAAAPQQPAKTNTRVSTVEAPAARQTATAQHETYNPGDVLTAKSTQDRQWTVVKDDGSNKVLVKDRKGNQRVLLKREIKATVSKAEVQQQPKEPEVQAQQHQLPKTIKLSEMNDQIMEAVIDNAYHDLDLDWAGHGDDHVFELREIKLTDLEKAKSRPLKLSDVDMDMVGRSRTITQGSKYEPEKLVGQPIVVDDDLSILDGMHRLADAIHRGDEMILAYVRQPQAFEAERREKKKVEIEKQIEEMRDPQNLQNKEWLENKKLAELQRIAKVNGFKRSGTKAEVIANIMRLSENLEAIDAMTREELEGKTVDELKKLLRSIDERTTPDLKRVHVNKLETAKKWLQEIGDLEARQWMFDLGLIERPKPLLPIMQPGDRVAHYDRVTKEDLETGEFVAMNGDMATVKWDDGTTGEISGYDLTKRISDEQKANSRSKGEEFAAQGKFLSGRNRDNWNPTHTYNGLPVETMEFPALGEIGYRYKELQSDLKSNKWGGTIKKDDAAEMAKLQPIQEQEQSAPVEQPQEEKLKDFAASQAIIDHMLTTATGKEVQRLIEAGKVDDAFKVFRPALKQATFTGLNYKFAKGGFTYGDGSTSSQHDTIYFSDWVQLVQVGPSLPQSAVQDLRPGEKIIVAASVKYTDRGGYVLQFEKKDAIVRISRSETYGDRAHFYFADGGHTYGGLDDILARPEQGIDVGRASREYDLETLKDFAVLNGREQRNRSSVKEVIGELESLILQGNKKEAVKVYKTALGIGPQNGYVPNGWLPGEVGVFKPDDKGIDILLWNGTEEKIRMTYPEVIDRLERIFDEQREQQVQEQQQPQKEEESIRRMRQLYLEDAIKFDTFDSFLKRYSGTPIPQMYRGSQSMASYLRDVYAEAHGEKPKVQEKQQPVQEQPSKQQRLDAIDEVARHIMESSPGRSFIKAQLDSGDEEGAKVTFTREAKNIGFTRGPVHFMGTTARPEIVINGTLIKTTYAEIFESAKNAYLEQKQQQPQKESEPQLATVKTESGREIEIRYKIVDAFRELKASHNYETLSPNEDYPAELQPRDRGRAASEEQVTRMAAKLEPSFLGESPKASEGAPITYYHVVESGNGRVLALQRAYRIGGKPIQKYQEWLKANLSKFGLSIDDFDGLKHPVLVRERFTELSPEERIAFVQEANVSSVAAMSPVEQAAVDAKKLTSGLLSLYNGDLEVYQASNREFVRQFMQTVIPANERGRYILSDGSLSQDGVRRIHNAIFARVYGATAALERMAESTDNNVRNITNAMLQAAGRMLKMKEAVERGDAFPLDITDDIAAAVNKLSELRDNDETVEYYLNQGDLFGEALSEEARNILVLFDTYKRNSRKIRDALIAYAEIALDSGSPNQSSLFEAAPPTKSGTLFAVISKVGEGEPDAQLSLFGQGQGNGQEAAGNSSLEGTTAGAQTQESRTGSQEKTRPQLEKLTEKDLKWEAESLRIPTWGGKTKLIERIIKAYRARRAMGNKTAEELQQLTVPELEKIMLDADMLPTEARQPRNKDNHIRRLLEWRDGRQAAQPKPKRSVEDLEQQARHWADRLFQGVWGNNATAVDGKSDVLAEALSQLAEAEQQRRGQMPKFEATNIFNNKPVMVIEHRNSLIYYQDENGKMGVLPVEMEDSLKPLQQGKPAQYTSGDIITVKTDNAKHSSQEWEVMRDDGGPYVTARSKKAEYASFKKTDITGIVRKGTGQTNPHHPFEAPLPEGDPTQQQEPNAEQGAPANKGDYIAYRDGVAQVKTVRPAKRELVVEHLRAGEVETIVIPFDKVHPVDSLVTSRMKQGIHEFIQNDMEQKNHLLRVVAEPGSSSLYIVYNNDAGLMGTYRLYLNGQVGEPTKPQKPARNPQGTNWKNGGKHDKGTNGFDESQYVLVWNISDEVRGNSGSLLKPKPEFKAGDRVSFNGQPYRERATGTISRVADHYYIVEWDVPHTGDRMESTVDFDDPSLQRETAPQPAPTQQQEESFLDRMKRWENDARKYIEENKDRTNSLPIDMFARYAVIGASKIAHGTSDFAAWSKEMMGEFGDWIRLHLPGMYAQAQAITQFSEADLREYLGEPAPAEQPKSEPANVYGKYDHETQTAEEWKHIRDNLKEGDIVTARVPLKFESGKNAAVKEWHLVTGTLYWVNNPNYGEVVPTIQTLKAFKTHWGESKSVGLVPGYESNKIVEVQPAEAKSEPPKEPPKRDGPTIEDVKARFPVGDKIVYETAGRGSFSGTIRSYNVGNAGISLYLDDRQIPVSTWEWFKRAEAWHRPADQAAGETENVYGKYPATTEQPFEEWNRIVTHIKDGDIVTLRLPAFKFDQKWQTATGKAKWMMGGNELWVHFDDWVDTMATTKSYMVALKPNDKRDFEKRLIVEVQPPSGETVQTQHEPPKQPEPPKKNEVQFTWNARGAAPTVRFTIKKGDSVLHYDRGVDGIVENSRRVLTVIRVDAEEGRITTEDSKGREVYMRNGEVAPLDWVPPQQEPEEAEPPQSDIKVGDKVSFRDKGKFLTFGTVAEINDKGNAKVDLEVPDNLAKIGFTGHFVFKNIDELTRVEPEPPKQEPPAPPKHSQTRDIIELSGWNSYEVGSKGFRLELNELLSTSVHRDDLPRNIPDSVYEYVDKIRDGNHKRFGRDFIRHMMDHGAMLVTDSPPLGEGVSSQTAERIAQHIIRLINQAQEVEQPNDTVVQPSNTAERSPRNRPNREGSSVRGGESGRRDSGRSGSSGGSSRTESGDPGRSDGRRNDDSRDNAGDSRLGDDVVGDERPADVVEVGQGVVPDSIQADAEQPGSNDDGATAGDEGLQSGERVGVDVPNFVEYVPQRITGQGHPGDVVEPFGLSLVSYPEEAFTDPKYKVHPKVTKGGDEKLSDIQLEAVQLAKYNFENGKKGMLIADDTGLGKTAEQVAIAADAIHSGKVKRVLIVTKNDQVVDGFLNENQKFDFGLQMTMVNSQSHSNFKDDHRLDLPWTQVKMDKMKPDKRKALTDRIAKNPYKPLNVPDGVMVMSQYTFRDSSYAVNEWLRGADGDVIVMFDESHIMKNVAGEDAAVVARVAKELYENLRETGQFIYSSATAAEDISGMEHLFGLKLWNPDTFSQFRAALQGQSSLALTGSSPFEREIPLVMMEQIVRELKLSGQYVGRALSMDGISMEGLEVVLTKEELAEWKRASEFIQLVAEEGEKTRSRNKQTAFFVGYMRRLRGYYVMKGVIRWMQQNSKNGVPPRSALSGFFKSGEDEETGENAMLEAAITQIKNTQVRSDLLATLYGKNGSRPVPHMPSPVDMLEDAFGSGSVAVISGDVSTGGRMAAVQEFQSGKKRIVYFTQSGNTGINLHDTIGEQITFVPIDYPWEAKEQKQSEGRVNRTGQKTKPKFLYPFTQSAVDKKFVGTLKARYEAMGALSRGKSVDLGGDTFGDFDFSGVEAQYAVYHVVPLLTVEERGAMFGSKAANMFSTKEDDGNTLPNDPLSVQQGVRELLKKDPTKKFLNSLMLLDVQTGTDVFNKFVNSYQIVKLAMAADGGVAGTFETYYGAQQAITQGKDGIKVRRIKTNLTDEQRDVIQSNLKKAKKRLADSEREKNLARTTAAQKLENQITRDTARQTELRAEYTKAKQQVKEIQKYNHGQTQKEVDRRNKKYKTVGEQLGRVNDRIRLNEVLIQKVRAGGQKAEEAYKEIPFVKKADADYDYAIYNLMDAQATAEANDEIMLLDGQIVTTGKMVKIREAIQNAAKVRYQGQTHRIPANAMRVEVRGYILSGGTRVVGVVVPAWAEQQVAEALEAKVQPQAPGVARQHAFAAPAVTPTTPAPSTQAQGTQQTQTVPSTTQVIVSGEVVKRSKIYKHIMKHFNVPIGTGRYRKRAEGIYTDHINEIRTKTYGKFVVLVHELGHRLDSKYGFSQDWHFAGELFTLGNSLQIPKGYTQDQIIEEGVAEFMRRYLYDPASAQLDAPTFYQHFEETLENDGKFDAMTDLNAMLQSWHMQSARQHMQSITDQGGPKKMSFIDRMRELNMGLYEELIGLDIAMKKLYGKRKNIPQGKKNIYHTAWRTRGIAGKIKAFLHYGVTDNEGNKIGKSLEEILSKKNVPDLSLFRDYLMALRGKELIEDQGRHKTPMESRQYDTIIYQTENGPHGQKYLDARDALYEYQNEVTNVLVEGGFLSPTQVTKWRKEHLYYVPFYRVMEESGTREDSKKSGNMDVGGQMVNLQNPIHAMKDEGSGRNIIDPLESIIKNTYLFLSLASRNEVGTVLLDNIRAVEDSAKVAAIVDNGVKGTTFNLFEIAKELKDAGFDTSDPKVDLDKYATVFRQTFYPDPVSRIVNVWEMGNIVQVQIRDEMAYHSLMALDIVPLPKWAKVLGFPNQLLKAGITLAPSFIPKNPMRGGPTFMVQTDAFTSPKDYLDLIPMYIKAFGSTMIHGEAYQKWIASGAAHSTLMSITDTYMSDSTDSLLRGTMKEKMKREFSIQKGFGMGIVMNAMRYLSELGDAPFRMIESQKTLEKTGDATLAAVRSRDVDLDFNKFGSQTRLPNALNMFFNIAVQGPNRVYRSFRDHPVRTPLRGFGLITLPVMLLYMLNRDDPEYWRLPQWERDLFIIIPTGLDGPMHFLKIPIPFEWGLLFKTIPERIAGAAFDEQPGFANLGKTAAGILIPSIIPTFIEPVIEWAFGGSMLNLLETTPTIPARLQNKAPEQQFTPQTSEVAKKLGEWTQSSPLKVEKLITGYTGTWGKMGLDAMDWGMKETGITNPPPKPEGSGYFEDKGMLARSFFTSPESKGSQVMEDFYTKLKKMENDYDRTGIKGDPPKPLSNFRKISAELNALRKIKDTIMLNKRSSPQAKRDTIDSVEKAMNDIAARAIGQKPLDVVNMARAKSYAETFMKRSEDSQKRAEIYVQTITREQKK